MQDPTKREEFDEYLRTLPQLMEAAAAAMSAVHAALEDVDYDATFNSERRVDSLGVRRG